MDNFTVKRKGAKAFGGDLMLVKRRKIQPKNMVNVNVPQSVTTVKTPRNAGGKAATAGGGAKRIRQKQATTAKLSTKSKPVIDYMDLLTKQHELNASTNNLNFDLYDNDAAEEGDGDQTKKIQMATAAADKELMDMMAAMNDDPINAAKSKKKQKKRVTIAKANQKIKTPKSNVKPKKRKTKGGKRLDSDQMLTDEYGGNVAMDFDGVVTDEDDTYANVGVEGVDIAPVVYNDDMDADEDEYADNGYEEDEDDEEDDDDDDDEDDDDEDDEDDEEDDEAVDDVYDDEDDDISTAALAGVVARQIDDDDDDEEITDEDGLVLKRRKLAGRKAIASRKGKSGKTKRGKRVNNGNDDDDDDDGEDDEDTKNSAKRRRNGGSVAAGGSKGAASVRGKSEWIVNEKDRVVINTRKLLHEPNFYNYIYSIRRLTTHDVPFFSAVQFGEVFKSVRKSKEKQVFTLDDVQKSSSGLSAPEEELTPAERQNLYECRMCLKHGPTMGVQQCAQCVKFSEFSYSFAVETKFAIYVFPLPTIFSPKAMNFFKSLISKAVEMPDTPEGVTEQQQLERSYYMNFTKQSFVGGSLSTIISGKNSWIRKKMLAYPTFGIRMTLTICSHLSPHVARIPKKLFDSLNLCTPLAILNRAPSINSRSVYVVELESQDQDDTIHLNPYVLDGLHADQDGDEIQVFIFKQMTQVPSFELKAATMEMRRLSWAYGTRRDMTYEPRYTFSQYHRFLLQIYDRYFCEWSPLWRSLRGTIEQRSKLAMDLGCSIMPDEVDAFVRLVNEVTLKLPMISISVGDVCTGSGQLLDIVNSGAKGSMEHIKLVTDTLFKRPDDFVETMVDKGFNKFVKSSLNMSREGVSQFTLLYAFNSIFLHKDNIYLNGSVIIAKNQKSQFIYHMNYNHGAVSYVFDSLLDDDEVQEYYDESDNWIVEYMKSMRTN